MTARRPIWDRRAVFASGAAAALLAATGVAAGGLPRQGGQLRLALSGAARDDSWVKGDGLFMQVARVGMVFDTLTEIAADGTLRGELATGWTSDADACNWQFDLRHDVVFHDGAPLTAVDVVASLSPQFDAQPDGRFGITVKLDQPDPNLPFALADAANVIRPAHAPDAGIGTGLYRVLHFAPGQQLIGERVTGHYKGTAGGWFDRIELASVPAASARAQAVMEHLVDGADLADSAALRNVPGVTTANGLQAVRTHVGMPMRVGTRQPIDDLRGPERWWRI